MIDKNDGIDFPTARLHQWKEKHEEVIRSLLLTHRSPWPLLRRFTEEGQIAQQVVDTIEQLGALFVDRNMEVPQHVIVSISRLRTELLQFTRRIQCDSGLKRLIKDIADDCREFMNYTGAFPRNDLQELESL